MLCLETFPNEPALSVKFETSGADTPKQTGGTDCGLYLLLFAEKIVSNKLNFISLWNINAGE